MPDHSIFPPAQLPRRPVTSEIGQKTSKGAELMRPLIVMFVLLAGSSLHAADAFPLQEGDRVTLVGGTFIEREHDAGWIELALTRSAPQANVTFRNLGWSGDDVTGRARRYFGQTEEGFQHLLTHLDLTKPTVILVNYGTNEAFAQEAGREAFLAGYRRLLDEFSKRTDRIVLISPLPLIPAHSPAPAIAINVNEELVWQTAALRALAEERGLGFLDLFTPLREPFEGSKEQTAAWTTNGMHLTSDGYRLVASAFELAATGQQWDASQAIALATQTESAQERALRQAIIEKNQLFFHRHRPQNETYLRGFRKHEQGNNAKEIFEFEPLVRQLDRRIFSLREQAF